MRKKRILWVDDEIDILRPHILFLEEKGYEVIPVVSGQDAIEVFMQEPFDIIFLDENMPGLAGLATLDILKNQNPDIPVIMITKSEDEGIMTDAIGKKIADYLIKPINPHQILLSLKKNLHKDDILSEAVLEGYRSEYNKLNDEINTADSHEQWIGIYKRLIHWELELSNSDSPLFELLHAQKKEADLAFCKFVKQNYENWVAGNNSPLLSHNVFKQKVFPLLDRGEHVIFLLIDNFRLDQWIVIRDLLASDFTITEDAYFSILPTATQYARNAIFAGLMPSQIAKSYPELWVDEEEAESKNANEEILIDKQLKRFRKEYTFGYNKLSTSVSRDRLARQINDLREKQLNVVVVNFVDMLSHSRTESKMIRELSADESAYRSLTRSWFRHSSTISLLKEAAATGCRIILTTDHGTIRVKNPIQIISDKSINDNVRYKVGRNIGYDRKKVYDVTNPEKVGLPSPNLSSKYIFATNADFFAYNNNYNHYVSYFANTFQHGGISMEEMIVPIITLTNK